VTRMMWRFMHGDRAICVPLATLEDHVSWGWRPPVDGGGPPPRNGHAPIRALTNRVADNRPLRRPRSADSKPHTSHVGDNRPIQAALWGDSLSHDSCRRQSPLPAPLPAARWPCRRQSPVLRRPSNASAPTPPPCSIHRPRRTTHQGKEANS
jgi:hypothetical protein